MFVISRKVYIVVERKLSVKKQECHAKLFMIVHQASLVFTHNAVALIQIPKRDVISSTLILNIRTILKPLLLFRKRPLIVTTLVFLKAVHVINFLSSGT